MKGNTAILETLNALLASELTAINQYIVHSEMCADWEYNRLHDRIEKRAIDEMKHAEKLIGRILFLEGTPNVSDLGSISIGPDVKVQFENDRLSETGAIKDYNQAIAAGVKHQDNGTRELLEGILKDEEDHILRCQAPGLFSAGDFRAISLTGSRLPKHQTRPSFADLVNLAGLFNSETPARRT